MINENYKTIDEKPIDSNEFANDLKLKEHNFEKEKTFKIITEWSTQQEKDRDLREKFGKSIQKLLWFQVIFFDIAFAGFYLLLTSKIIEEIYIEYWLSGLVIEIIGIAIIIAKGLFKNTTSDFFKLIEQLFK